MSSIRWFGEKIRTEEKIVREYFSNSLCDVGLITNQSVPAKYDSLFKSHDINIWEGPFEEFVFSKKNKWHLAFYKLASL